MNTLLWVLQALLSAAMVMAGILKMMKSRAELAPKMAWVNAFTDQQVKLIGLAELLGGIGVVVPAATGILPILTPIAASALAFIMGGAVATHMRLKEGRASLIPASVLGMLALVVAVGRFVIVPLS